MLCHAVAQCDRHVWGHSVEYHIAPSADNAMTTNSESVACNLFGEALQSASLQT